MKYRLIILIPVLFVTCIRIKKKADELKQTDDTSAVITNDTIPSSINTLNTKPGDVIKYAETLIGTPYLYASTDPQQGFDCSGFITFVFNNFNIHVPRSSVEFTNVAPEVLIDNAKPGDLILFTGTDSTERVVGHMGIIISNDAIQTLFIHCSSGKANGVTITPLNDYYKSRFVKVIRIFPQNN